MPAKFLRSALAGALALFAGAAQAQPPAPTLPLGGGEWFQCWQSHGAKACTPAQLQVYVEGQANTFTPLQTFSGSIALPGLGAHGLLIGEGAGAAKAVSALGLGQIVVGQGQSNDPVGVTVSGDAVLSQAGVLTVSSFDGGILLKSAAGYDVGTSGAKVAALSGANTWGAIQTLPGLVLTPGAVPSSPASGQFWTTGSGVFVSLAGTTYQLGGSPFGVSTFNGRGGVVSLQASDLTGLLTNPGPIGATTPNTGSFTTLLGTTSAETADLSPNQNVWVWSQPGNGTSNVYSDFSLVQSNVGNHTATSHTAFSLTSVPAGSGVNGPGDADVGMYLSVIKNNWQTSSQLGEIDGLSIVTRQGSDDSDAILVNAGGVNGYFGVLEGATSQFDSSGNVLKQIDVQVASIETGLTGSAGSHGLIINSNTGTSDVGLLIQSNNGAGWTEAIQVNANGDPNQASFTLSTSGQMFLATGITGETDGGASAPGIQGENQAVTSAAVSMTAYSPINCASKALTAGDWIVWGAIDFIPAASTTIQGLYGGLNTASATLPSGTNETQLLATFSSYTQGFAVPAQILNLSAGATVYLVGQASFGTSTMTCSGSINAIRYH